MFDSVEIVRDNPFGLTLIESQQQWSLRRRYERNDEFVWCVTSNVGAAFFEDSLRAMIVFRGTDGPAMLSIKGKVMQSKPGPLPEGVTAEVIQ